MDFSFFNERLPLCRVNGEREVVEQARPGGRALSLNAQRATDKGRTVRTTADAAGVLY